MAYTQTPTQSTYQTKKLKINTSINSRGASTSKDDDFLNCYHELVRNRETKEDYFNIIKRSGSTQFIASTDSGGVRGLYYWKDQNKLYKVVLDKIYIYTATTGTLVTTINTAFGTTSGDVGFTEFLYSTGVTKLVVTDGTTLSTIDSANTQVKCVDADMPVHLPMPVFLDGYIFVVKAGTADIYNSDNDNPLSWTAGNFINAEIEGDIGNGLAKINNYLVCFGSKSIEYFWDAAIATGSPLQRNDTPVKFIGYISGLSYIGNKLFFIGAGFGDHPDVFMLEDFKVSALGTSSFRRHLENLSGDLTTLIKAKVVSIDGNTFYVIYTGSATYVLNLDTNLMTRWGYQTGSTFPMTNAISMVTTSGTTTLFTLNTDQAIYRFSATLYQDNGVTFSVIFVTQKEEFETYNQKFMYSLTLWADKVSVSTPMTVQWTDDDYNTYNTGHDLDLFTEKPQIQRLGRFRYRAFKFTFTANQPMRFYGVEVDINIGQT